MPVPAPRAVSCCHATPPDLMLVDLMLGRMDGFTFIRTARAVHDAPVIVLSARDDTHDIVAALEAGADDYVTKPFELKEVTARLRAPCAGAAGRRRRPGGRRLVLDATARLTLELDAGRVTAAAPTSTSPSPSSGCCASSRRRRAAC